MSDASVLELQIGSKSWGKLLMSLWHGYAGKVLLMYCCCGCFDGPGRHVRLPDHDMRPNKGVFSGMVRAHDLRILQLVGSKSQVDHVCLLRVSPCLTL